MIHTYIKFLGLPLWLSGKEFACNAGDSGLILGPGRSHMPWNNEARAPQLLSLGSLAHKPQLLKPAHSRAHAPQQEKPLQ